jgi:hypothetical protein
MIHDSVHAYRNRVVDLYNVKITNMIRWVPPELGKFPNQKEEETSEGYAMFGAARSPDNSPDLQLLGVLTRDDVCGDESWKKWGLLVGPLLGWNMSSRARSSPSISEQ